ncbi:bacterial Ig-like domain-containing protein [Lachnospiraceae bacterium 48-42]
MTVKAGADVTCLNGYVYIPENDYTGRNQCLSPRVVEGLDGTLYATFENGIPSEIEEGEYSFPVYESKDKGDTWKRVGEIINDDKVHPDSYYKITKYTDVGAPSEAVEVQQGEEGAVRHPWSLQCCPQLYVLPEDQGELKKGTLVCAGVAVPLEEGAEKVSDAGYGGLWESSLDFYYSTDGGRSWIFKSIIAEGGENGRNIMGYDPVWEPFFLYHEKNLICYYSDETDPQHAQKLVYKITTDGGATWGEPVDIVSINNRGARPGMPIVTELENGNWMMVYETVGMTNPIKSGVKIAKDPYNWNLSEPGSTLPGIRNVYGGSPYVFTLKDGRVVAGTGSLSEVFVNTENDGTGEWVAKATGAPAGYNRCFFQLSTGELFITGTEGPGFASQNNKIFAKRVWADAALDVTLDHIEVTAPVKISYKMGEELDLTGMKAEAVYSDGSKKDITEKARIEGFDTSTAGQQKITVTYGKKTAEFTVTVKKVYKVKISYRAEEGNVRSEEDGTWKEIGRDEIIEILEDGSKKFQIVPSEGYEIANVRLGEESVLDQVTTEGDGNGTITLEGTALEGMPADITLMAVFKAKEAAYRIRPGVNGTITADKPLAGAGEEVTFTFTPADKYKLADVLVNEQPVMEKVTVDSETKTGTLKIKVEQDMVISAVFKQIYEVTVSYRAEEGSVKAAEGDAWKDIARDEIVEILEDGSQKFQIVPAEGYEIANVRLGEESVLDQVKMGTDGSGTITLENMTADTTLSAVFKAKEAAYRIRPGVNGTITADKPLAGAGEEVTFTFTPADKYELTDVQVNDQSVMENVTVDSETKTGHLSSQ